MRCSRHRYVLACDLQTGNRTVPAQTSNSRVNTLLVLLSSNQFNLENQAEYMTESKLRPPSYFMDVWDISARTRNVCMCVYACVCLRNWFRTSIVLILELWWLNLMKERGSSQYNQELKKQEKIYRLFTSPPPVFGALISPTFIFPTSRQVTWYENVQEYSPSTRDLFHR